MPASGLDGVGDDQETAWVYRYPARHGLPGDLCHVRTHLSQRLAQAQAAKDTTLAQGLEGTERARARMNVLLALVFFVGVTGLFWVLAKRWR